MKDFMKRYPAINFVLVSLVIIGLWSYFSNGYNEKLSQAVTAKYQQQFKQIGVDSIYWSAGNDFFSEIPLGVPVLTFLLPNNSERQQVHAFNKGQLKYWSIKVNSDGVAHVYFSPDKNQDFESCSAQISDSIDELLDKAKKSKAQFENAANSWR